MHHLFGPGQDATDAAYFAWGADALTKDVRHTNTTSSVCGSG